MVDDTNGNGSSAAAAADPQGAVFSLQKLYLKDVSFESAERARDLSGEG